MLIRIFNPLNNHIMYLIFQYPSLASQQGWHLLLLIFCFSIFPELTTPATTLKELGQTDFQQGHFESAIRRWEADLDTNKLSPLQRIEIMIQLGRAYQTLGFSQQALTILSQAEQLANPLIDTNQPLAKDSALTLSLLFTSLSDVSLATRTDNIARHYADKSLAILPPEAPPLIRATALNNLGNVLTVEAYYTPAVQTYSRSIELAQQAGDSLLAIKALINMAYAHSKTQQWQSATEALHMALRQFKSLDKNYATAFGLLSLGAWAQRIQHAQRQTPTPTELHQLAHQALNSALQIATQLNHNSLISNCYGFLGQLYETEQHYEKALRFTRQAIFYAQQDQSSFFTQQAQASDILYRWQWQLGRIFKAQHQIDQAINAYRQAVNSLQQSSIRQELATGYRSTSQSFRERIGPVYFELADLLLQRAVQERHHANAQEHNRWLKEALFTIELIKTAELQDYFQDECVTESKTKRNLLDNNRETEAVIYPILLPDRIEILLKLPQNIQQFTVALTANRLKDEVNEFRFELETRQTTDFLPYAQRLYRWLITPLLDSLTTQHIETLIIISDGALRTIPFAALHDGEQFLISQYAIVTTPGLTLTESKSNLKNHTNILIGGLSLEVPGYSKLSSVRKEAQFISRLYANEATTLLDQDFTVDNFANALKNQVYSIVHIASHGQFDGDPQKTFLLTHDGKLTVNQLEELIGLSDRRQEPMELLTLSACQTAVGDDQAALGLAGLALKAGARSALASLWFIDDEATRLLMSEFYRYRKEKQVSKAKALQMAQQHLLKHSHYQHPAYWAPFLLIGSWE